MFFFLFGFGLGWGLFAPLEPRLMLQLNTSSLWVCFGFVLWSF